MAIALACWKHLRIPFQLTLAPIFMWGVFLSGSHSIARVVVGFLAFHLFLYGGITAFNSAFDNDTGPVGGMLVTPPVPSALTPISVYVIAVGMSVAMLLGPEFLLVYSAIAALGIAYSLPGVRLKASPAASALTVFFGQGVLGCVGGWIAGAGVAGIGSATSVMGALTAGLTALGIYPVTQVYQVDEDAARGDRTIAVALGPERAMRFATCMVLLGGAAATLLMSLRSGRTDAALIAIGYAIVAAQVWSLGQAYRKRRHTVLSGFRAAMRLNCVTAASFLVFIGLHWIHGL